MMPGGALSRWLGGKLIHPSHTPVRICVCVANLLIKGAYIYYMQDHVSSYKLSTDTAALLLRLPQITIS